MRTSLYRTLAVVTVIVSIAQQRLFADDMIVMPNKKEIRCRIIEFSGGVFTFEDVSGKVARIGSSAIIRIRFDAPDAAPAAGVDAVGPSIEQVNAFPEKFVGRALIFQHCDISQKLERLRESDNFALSLTSKGGEYITPIVGRDRITFIVSKAVAEKMSVRIEGGYSWPDCTVKCTIQKMTLDSEDVLVALVSRIDVYNRGGKVSTVFGE